MSEQRRGFLYGVAAYALWGLFPLYWPLLEPAGAVEILAHRVVWAALVVMGLIAGLRRVDRVRTVLRDRRARSALGVAAAVIGFNWGAYIWGVNNGYVLETALGYYINPLFTVLLGLVVLGERLRPLQWAALGIAFAAVLELTIGLGRPPWVSLILAVSFGTYGLAKKKADVGALEGLTVETVLLAPVALLYIGYLTSRGANHFGTSGIGPALLLAGTGLVTVGPLLCFGAAATRVSLTTLGLLQYLAPTIQFVIAVLVLGEEMPPARWVGFGLVWLALVILAAEAVSNSQRQLRRAAECVAV